MRHLLPLLLLACAPADGTIALDYCAVDGAAELEPETAPLTWSEHIAPLAEAHCAVCHNDPADGTPALAPFPLTSVADWQGRRSSVRSAIANERMPPWSADDCCGRAFRHSRALPEADRAALLGWLDQGAPAGEAPESVSAVGFAELPRVDAVVAMPEAYTPEARWGSDDVRCFLAELPEAVAGTYLVGSRVVPGNRTVVHHVATSIVRERDVAELEALDAADPGPGWDCYGGGVLGQGSVGGYVPGQGAVEMPAGVGHAIPEASRVLINMHYDVSQVVPGTEASDQTRVELMVAAEVEREMRAIPVLHPLWLFADGMHIEGDFAETAYGVSWDPTLVYGQRAWDVWGVFFHMHELGQSGSVAILREDGSQECLLHLPEWDFDWQADYLYTEPVRLEPGEQVYMECRWMNPGEDIAWETDQEMCAAVLYVTEAL